MIAIAETRVDQLISLFNKLFIPTYNTELVRGAREPIYLPGTEIRPYHQVIFAHGYFASALHEIAHWCIAGRKRRVLEDYGYWYRPDGRSPSEQVEFEQVEIKPQALEWIFSVAAKHSFFFSADNLDAQSSASSIFKMAVWERIQIYLSEGLPKRAQLFTQALCIHFEQPYPLSLHQFPKPQA